jgi:NAD(P)-dependent dehydrogenase (short-subunit alcohol dehydrogenase family)
MITGCSTGFGLETALAFARQGDTVYATMRNLAKSDPLTSIHRLTFERVADRTVVVCSTLLTQSRSDTGTRGSGGSCS